jgi:hypothetical protein
MVWFNTRHERGFLKGFGVWVDHQINGMQFHMANPAGVI